MTPSPFTGRSIANWVQLLGGVALLVGALATWSPRWAAGVAGALLIADFYCSSRRD